MASLAPFGPGGATNSNSPTPISHQSTTTTSSSLARGRKWMKVLCWAQLVLAVFALTLGSACTGINSGHQRTVCTFGTGIWVGLLSLCCAFLGLAAIQPSRHQRKLLIGYFLMCVSGSLAAIILFGISCMWIERASKFYKVDSESYELTSVTLNSCLLVAAICQTICTFLSAVLLAHFYWGWCCRSNDFASPIAYVRAEEPIDHHQSLGDGGQTRSHLYARRTDPHYTNNSRRTSETNTEANVHGNKFFY